VPLIPHYLANIVLGQIDRVMISNYAGESEVAIYSLSIQISLIMNFVNSAIWSSLTPWIYQTIDGGKTKEIKKIASLLSILMSAFILIPAIAAPEVIFLLGTKEYADGIWLIAPVSLTVLLRFIYGFFSTIQFYYGYSYYSTIVSVFGAILDVGLNGLLIPKYGYKFAGYTTLICYCVMTCMHYYYMKKTLKKQQLSLKLFDMKCLSATIVLSFVFSFVCMCLYSTVLIRYLFGFIMELLILGFVLWKYRKSIHKI
jgi:O-antigen/teichoic acid export membrane protein